VDPIDVEHQNGGVMAQSHDEQLSGDLPLTPSEFEDEENPSLSHNVVATYVADAVRSVEGVVGLHHSPWKGLSSRVREMHAGGIAVREGGPGAVDLDIHVRVAWGAFIPELAREVEEAVRERCAALLSIDLGRVTLFVDEIAAPAEAGFRKEG
jgi:uncharacterized alkaline shock family protein YloU